MNSAAPLSGLHVVEIGDRIAVAACGSVLMSLGAQTTVVEHELGAFGAHVVKVESPDGDGTRRWAPRQDDQGYFFALSNTDKQSLRLDLRTEADRAHFVSRLEKAGVRASPA